MLRVVIESPFAGDRQRNERYARLCLVDSLQRGEAPIASHLLYTQPGVLDDDEERERLLGIEAGLRWVDVADLQVFYVDLGESKGMRMALEYGRRSFVRQEFRNIDGELWRQFLSRC